jgi:nucleoside-diphosphate-sugar epimerase
MRSMSELGIVIGGSGFIGRHLLRRLVQKSRHERIVSIDIAEPREHLPGVTYVRADARKHLKEEWGAAGSTIYDLAAICKFPGHAASEYYETNIGTSQRIIDFAEETKASTVVFTSSIAVYGSSENAMTESSAVQPTTPYGHSKLLAERLFRSWHRRNPKAKLIIVRPAVIFGEGEGGNYTRLARALAWGYFVYVGRRDAIKSCGYVEDLIESLFFALDKSEPLILYNFAYPQAYKLKDIVDTFCRVAGFRAPSLSIPSFIASTAALPWEWLDAVGFRNSIHRDRIRKLNESTHIRPRWLVENGFEFNTTLDTALKRWQSASLQRQFL